MTKTTVLTEAIAAFERDGAVALKGYFADWVEVLRAGIARNMAEPSADVKIYKGRDGGGRFFGDYCNWDRIRNTGISFSIRPRRKLAAS